MPNIFERDDTRNAMQYLDVAQQQRAAALIVARDVDPTRITDHRVALAVFIASGVEDYETITQHSAVRDVLLDQTRKEHGLDG